MLEPCLLRTGRGQFHLRQLQLQPPKVATTFRLLAPELCI